MVILNRIMLGSRGAGLAFAFLVATSLWSADFSFTTGTPDGLMGAASRRASPGKLETETADDFTLDQTTVISRATIVGLVPSGTQLSDIKEVEVEVYHVFPLDSAMPPSGKVPSRANSPSDVEIGTSSADRVSSVMALGYAGWPSTLMTRGEGPPHSARRRNIFAATRSRLGDNTNSMVAPVESTAR